MEVILLGEIRAILVKIDNELDHHIAGYIREAADGRIRSTNAVNVIFDFSNVGFMDSSGIGVIMGRYKSVKMLGGKVVVFGLNSAIRRIIEMSGINNIVSIAESFDEAVRML